MTTRTGVEEREARVLTYLAQHEGWVTSAVVGDAIGVNRSTIVTTLTRMVGEGKLVSRVPALGGGYRLAGEPMETMHDDPAPVAPPAPAPVSSPPERPAAVAPAPQPDVESAPAADEAAFSDLDRAVFEGWKSGRSGGPVPFAGVLMKTTVDDELKAINECVGCLESLDERAKVRAITYLADRYLP